MARSPWRPKFQDDSLQPHALLNSHCARTKVTSELWFLSNGRVSESHAADRLVLRAREDRHREQADGSNHHRCYGSGRRTSTVAEQFDVMV